MSNIKAQWDLSVFYKSISDKEIDLDFKRAQKAFISFEKKYKDNKKYLLSENALYSALSDFENLSSKPLNKPLIYLSYLQTLNSSDEQVQAKLNLLSQEYSKLGNRIMFFSVRLSKLEKKLQDKFLKSKKLKPFHYFLKTTFDSGRYVLTEPEEKILSLKSITSRGMWTDLTEKLTDKLIIEHNGERMPINKAIDTSLHLPSQEERLALHKKCMQEIEKVAEVATAELNAVVTDKKINDEIRGYKEPFDATILGYENDRKSVLNLVRVVTDGFKVSNRFYKVKAKMLKLPKLNYSDRGADIGNADKKISYTQSYEILKDVFDRLDPEFGTILKTMAENGQIDAYPKVGKRGGAFCSSHTATPTFVMLNHNDSLKSHFTFAHEMGHAIHSELSKIQPAMYEGYSTSTAETASTLFETFVFYDALEKMTDEEKIVALHDRISDDVSTIFRQIACFNFEAEMHQKIRAQGSLSKEEFAKMMNKHMKAYLGDTFELSDSDGLFFVTWHHLRYMFYVYSYAYGQLTSKALYKKYSEDKKYITQIKKFMSLGGSMSPEDIFKSIGIDVKKPDFFRKGIESINEDIARLERLVEKSARKS